MGKTTEWVVCPRCNGRASVPDSFWGVVVCHVCKITGIVRADSQWVRLLSRKAAE